MCIRWSTNDPLHLWSNHGWWSSPMHDILLLDHDSCSQFCRGPRMALRNLRYKENQIPLQATITVSSSTFHKSLKEGQVPCGTTGCTKGSPANHAMWSASRSVLPSQSVVNPSALMPQGCMRSTPAISQ